MNTGVANIPIPPDPVTGALTGPSRRGTGRAATDDPRFEQIARSAAEAHGQDPRTPLADAKRNGATEDPGREAAEELIAVTFLMPLMKMARNDPFKSELFHGGQGEEAFGGQLDQELARGMIDGMDLPLVDAVRDQLTARRTAGAAPSMPRLDAQPVGRGFAGSAPATPEGVDHYG